MPCMADRPYILPRDVPKCWQGGSPPAPKETEHGVACQNAGRLRDRADISALIQHPQAGEIGEEGKSTNEQEVKVFGLLN